MLVCTFTGGSAARVTYMGRTKETVNLQLMGSQHEQMDEYDEYLYTV
jgi:hypothetical protein